MFALIAAVIFALALLLDLLNVKTGDAFNNQTLVTAGLFCIAMHLAGFATAWRSGVRSRRR